MKPRAITDHARKRIRKRVGTKHADKMFAEALEHGVKQNETKGDLKRYLAKGAMQYKASYVIYKNMVYWHDNGVLITVIPLASKFHKYIKN